MMVFATLKSGAKKLMIFIAMYVCELMQLEKEL
jgi:hypothetical protein